MAIESATYLSQLSAVNPAGTDQRSTADDHLRLIKAVLTNTFPDLRSEVSASAGEMNRLRGVAVNIQNKLDELSAAIAASLSLDSTASGSLLIGGTIKMQGVGFLNIIENESAGGSPSVNWANSPKAHVKLTETSATFSFSPPTSPCNLLMKLTQGTGGNKSADWPAAVLWANGSKPELSTTAGASDIITMYFDGSAYYGTALTGF